LADPFQFCFLFFVSLLLTCGWVQVEIRLGLYHIFVVLLFIKVLNTQWNTFQQL